MDDGWPRSRAYVLGSVANWVAFLAGVYLLSRADGLAEPVVFAVVLVLALSVAGHFFAAYRLIARQDEYIRSITAKRIIAGAGLTFTVAVFWGLAEQFLGARDVPMWVAYPFFWGAFGMVTPLIRDTRP